MKILASTGGKGGVGKSTFAILLAFKLNKQGKKVVLADLDVECPNDYLLLDQKLKNPSYVYSEFPELIKEKCTKCGVCSQICKEHAIFWVKGKYPIFIHDLCSGCGACWLTCPFKAIRPKKEVSGEYFINRVKEDFWLITGRSKAGVSETGPIVKEIKSKAIEFAKEKKVDHLIIDTAPGTHCNVIQALLNCDKAYAVTEPTPLGAYDLNLILQLTEKLKVHTEIVLNKADVGDKKRIEKIAKKFGRKVSVEIPYSEDLVKAYCKKDLEKVVDLI